MFSFKATAAHADRSFGLGAINTEAGLLLASNPVLSPNIFFGRSLADST
jgi:hypothetical protein